MAANPKTPSKLISRLARKNKDLHTIIINNPAAPSKVLLRLARPSKINSRDYVIARHPNCSPKLLANYVSKEDINLRVAVADNPQTPSKILATLSHDSDHRICLALAKNTATPQSVLSTLSQSSNLHVRRYAILAKLHSTSEIQFHPANKNLPPVSLQRKLLRDVKTLSSVLTELAKDLGPEIRAMVARHPNTPEEVLIHLTEDPYSIVRKEAKKQLQVQRWLEAYREQPFSTQWLADKRWEVRRFARYHPNVDTYWLELLICAGSSNDMRIYNLPDKNMSPEELTSLLPLGHWAQCLVAWHPNTSFEILIELAKSKIREIRRAVAQNHNAPIEVFERLVEDSIWSVRSAVARNPYTPTDIRQLLENDKVVAVQHSLKIGKLYRCPDKFFP